MDADSVLDRRRLRRRASFWRVAAFLLAAIALLALISATSGLSLQGTALKPQVARIKVDGFIATRPDAVELIDKAAKAEGVRAIVLRIDSPGGAASGGEALYRAVREASARKPVVAVIDGLGTSAAYMTAIAADHIVARESAITGSIGVIFQLAHVEDLLGKLGVEYVEVKSSPLKAEPSPFEPPSPEALAMVQAVVNDSYQWFVGLVAERRNFPQAEALRLADGSIFTGRQALRLKLIDALGDEDQARAWLATEKGVSETLAIEDWEEDDTSFLFGAQALSGLVRLLGLDPSLAPAVLIPERLAVDGLLSVWQASPSLHPSR
jgi:protease IV